MFTLVTLLHLADQNHILHVSRHFVIIKFWKLTIYDNLGSEIYLIMM